MSFKEIRLLSVDEVRTHKVDSEDSIYNVYFELSIVPPIEWKNILEKNSRKMQVDGRHVVVQCLFSEIDDVFKDARKEVVRTNQKYREYLQRNLTNENNNDKMTKTVSYFIIDMTVHKYPVSDDHIIYNGQKLYGTIPKGFYVKCNICF